MTAARTSLAALALALAVVACSAPPSPASPSPEGAPGSNDAAASTGASDTSAPSDMAPTSPSTMQASPSAPARPPRPAQASYPAGLEPLDEAEAAALEKECKAFTDAVMKEGKKAADKARDKRVTDVILEVAEKLRSTPAAGPNGRCADLLARDTRAYAAKSHEAEAVARLRISLMRLADHWEQHRKLCSAIAEVPRDVERLREPLLRAALGAEAPTTDCVAPGFADTPIRWSIALRIEPDGKTFTISSRGFPVPGGAVEELFVTGTVGAEGVPRSLEVMRR